jgi:hypothetical protein
MNLVNPQAIANHCNRERKRQKETKVIESDIRSDMDNIRSDLKEIRNREQVLRKGLTTLIERMKDWTEDQKYFGGLRELEVFLIEHDKQWEKIASFVASARPRGGPPSKWADFVAKLDDHIIESLNLAKPMRPPTKSQQADLAVALVNAVIPPPDDRDRHEAMVKRIIRQRKKKHKSGHE